MSNSSQSPVSRRARPSKPALSREDIIATALRLFRAEGLGKVTMRSVARELDTGHASLYVYVRDTTDLHAQILDAELSAVRLPSGSGPWRSELIALLLDYQRVLFSHVEIARTVFFAELDGPNYLALVESVLALLARGKITGRTAAWGVTLLLQLTAASAAEHSDAAGSSTSPPQRHVHDDDRDLDADRYPQLTAVRGELFSGTPLERTEWTINLQIDGLLAARKA